MDNPGNNLKDVFHVAGDAPDPEGTGLRGVAPGYDLTKSAVGHPKLLYKLPTGEEIVLEADVYDGPDGRYIYLLCPRCLASGRNNQLRIRAGIKQFSYERGERVPLFPGWSREQMKHAFPNGAGGLLSVEPFRCTWEEAPDLQRDHGLNQCTWSVSIDKNVVKDA